MGYQHQGTNELRRIQAETARHDFFNSHELPWNVFGIDSVEANRYRSEELLHQKLEMYSVPMPSIFNFHLKVDENQQHQFQLQAPPNNGMFLKKEILAANAAQHAMPPPPVAHSSQAQHAPRVQVQQGQPQQQQQQQVSVQQGQPNTPEIVFNVDHHIKVNKANNKPYSCNYCSKNYKQLMGMKKHIKNHIVNGQAQAVPNNILHGGGKHVQHQHQQQQQFYLNPPGSSYQMKNNHHEEEDDSVPDSEKQYSCQYCNKRFQHPSTLKMHCKKHTDDKPFLCSHCNKTFKRNSSLKIHERTHTGEKTHECSYCGKLFAYEVFLKVHIRKHTGEKPYNCRLCDKTFTQAGNLKSHVKRKHIGSEDILNNL